MSAPLTPRGAPAPTVTEREAVLREREAFDNGATCARLALQCKQASQRSLEEIAKRDYPLPKITRPRVVRDFSLDTTREFRVVDGVIQARDIGRLNQEWGTEGLRGWKVDAAVIRTFADLLANPTEEIEDDGSVSLLPGEET